MAEPSEIELLRAVTRLHLPSPSHIDLAPLLRGVDWHRVLWLGRQEGVLPLLLDSLKAHNCTAACPPEVLAQLEALREALQLRTLGHARELCLLHDAFGAKSLAALPLTPLLATRFTGGFSMAEHPGQSLPHLVRPEDRDRAEAVLRGAGHPLESDPGQLIFFNRSPVPLRTTLGGADDIERLWARTDTVDLGGRTFRILAREHWLLFLLLRTGAMPSLARAGEIVSLVATLPPESRDAILPEAARFGLELLARRALSTSFTRLQLPVPSVFFAEPPESAPLPDTPISLPLAPFLPTPYPVVHRMLSLAAVHAGDVLYDLGCGDGRLLIAGAKKYGARGIGIDCDPVRLAEASAQAAAAGVSERLSWVDADLFSTDLTDATVVICYLLPQLMPPLRRKLQRELRPGARVVSLDFTFDDWTPEKTEIIRTGPATVAQIYRWRRP